MDSFFIEPDWLESVRGTLFFYPAAGSDYAEPLNVFKNHLDTFWFCDKSYQRGLNLAPVFEIDADFCLVGRHKSGAVDAREERRRDKSGNEYSFLEPSRLSENYESSDGRRLNIVRRRGFGQIALTKEFDSRSIGVFMHRGDSPGEGGSNVYFLANKKASFEPCGNLFDKLGQKLADNALVVTDGSNAHITRLRRLHRKNMDGAVAYEYYRGKSFIFGGFCWSCVGWMSMRYGPTLAWGLQRLTGQDNVLGG